MLSADILLATYAAFRRSKAKPTASATIISVWLPGFEWWKHAEVALVASGLIHGWFLVGSLSALIGTTYGELLLLSLAYLA